MSGEKSTTMNTQHEIKHIESSVKIYFTTEYGRFRFMKGNRDLVESKIKKIVKAIDSGIDVLKYSPIIVNKQMEIIDGQHRFAVSKQLKTNVYYVIKEDADLSIVPAINSNSSKWRTADFLASYVDLGKQSYKSLQSFLDTFPKTSISTAAKMFHSGKVNSPEAMEAFKDGVLLTDYQDFTYQIANMLQNFEPFMDNPFSGRMFMVMSLLKDNGKYEHSVMLAKLDQSGKRIEDIGSSKSIIGQMELIYNHHAQKRTIIY